MGATKSDSDWLVQHHFLSTPVRMHGGLIWITLRLSGVTGPKLKTRK